jgi:hypothetical protein
VSYSAGSARIVGPNGRPIEFRDGAIREADVDTSGWDHPPPPGTVKMTCDQCTLWFSSRGNSTCPICVADPEKKRKRRYLQKRKVV